MRATGNEQINPNELIGFQGARLAYVEACAQHGPDTEVGQELRRLNRFLSTEVRAVLSPVHAQPELPANDLRTLALLAVLPLITQNETIAN